MDGIPLSWFYLLQIDPDSLNFFNYGYKVPSIILRNIQEGFISRIAYVEKYYRLCILLFSTMIFLDHSQK